MQLMRQTIILALLTLCICSTACGQKHKKPDQEKISRSFLELMLNQKYEKAMKYFSEEALQHVDLAQVTFAGNQLKEEAKTLGLEFHFSMTQKIFQEGHTYTAYTFKFDRDVTKGPFGLMMNVIFEDEEATKIVGFNYKRPVDQPRKPGESVSTSRGREDRIGEPQTWVIDGKEFKIIEISLVHFAKEESMLAIKVEYDFETMDEASAKVVGLPIAKEAFRRNWLETATEKTKAANKILLDQIGIALCKPGLKEGYRVTFQPGEYKE